MQNSKLLHLNTSYFAFKALAF